MLNSGAVGIDDDAVTGTALHRVTDEDASGTAARSRGNDPVLALSPELPGRYARWEKDTRYYELRVQQDLFGNWLLTRVWGRKGSALGQIWHELCENYPAGIAKFNQAEVRREQRGYRLINPGVPEASAAS